MRYLYLNLILALAIFNCNAQNAAGTKLKINALEDIFRIENVDQLSAFFGKENVFTESVFYNKPDKGGKGHLVSQVNFGTSKAVLVIWNEGGTLICGVQASAYFYDYKAQRMRLIPSEWKTKQGVHAGLKLMDLVKINWFKLWINTQKSEKFYGNLSPGFGWLKNETKVSFSEQKLIYEYTIDLKQIVEYFPKQHNIRLVSTNKLVRKWNPLLEMISIYREGMKPIS